MTHQPKKYLRCCEGQHWCVFASDDPDAAKFGLFFFVFFFDGRIKIG